MDYLDQIEYNIFETDEDTVKFELRSKLWDKKQTKLEIAAGMVRHAMDNTGPDRQVFLLCDSWYPEGCVAGLVDEYHNLDIICNARIDTAMYDLPPGRTGKRFMTDLLRKL